MVWKDYGKYRRLRVIHWLYIDNKNMHHYVLV
jgi:hypothetical protein